MPQNAGDFLPWFGVFETVRVVEGTPLFVAEHLEEITRAAQALGIARAFDPMGAARELPRVSGRWRWVVTPTEARSLFSPGEIPVPGPVEIAVSPVRVGSMNWDARFKTVSYLSHAQAGEIALTPEVVLLNEHGHVASAARGNLFWRRGSQIFTPAHEAGCRRGVVRGFVLKQEKVEEGHFSPGEMLEAEEIFITNSIKGIVSVSRVEGRELSSPDAATRLRKLYDEAVAKQRR